MKFTDDPLKLIERIIVIAGVVLCILYLIAQAGGCGSLQGTQANEIILQTLEELKDYHFLLVSGDTLVNLQVSLELPTVTTDTTATKDVLDTIAAPNK
jgi:hypothetical protein